MSYRLVSSVVALLCLLGSAQAQRTQDTVRIAVYQPIPMIDLIYNPHPETIMLTDVVFDSPVYFDAAKREYRPLLAKSWQRTDDNTYEFKLREGIKFHDGSALTADDVVYSLEVFMDPKYNFRFKDSRFGWIDKVEKVDDFTVRIKSKEVFAPFLSRMSSIPIYPARIYRELENKSDFGRKPIGTGPYRVVSFDPTKGEIAYERFEAYTLGDVRAGKIKRILVSSIPDQQTQIAKLLSGGLDLVFGLEPDIAPTLAANPTLAISMQRTVSYAFIQFDTRDRSGIGVFKDKRVREAMLKAIDVDALIKAFVPPEHQNDPPQIAMCHEWHVACSASLKPVRYDLEGAKKLLAEAGIANGFDLSLATWGPTRRIAEAIAGQLKKVGVNGKVDTSTFGVYIQKLADGKIQTQVSLWDNAGTQPDVENTMAFFFLPSSRDMIGDPVLAKAVDEGRAELDPKKREAIYRAAFDRVTAERYMMPLVPLPAIVAHDKDLQLLPGYKAADGVRLNFLAWK